MLNFTLFKVKVTQSSTDSNPLKYAADERTSIFRMGGALAPRQGVTYEYVFI